jgi:hypothetical protein
MRLMRWLAGPFIMLSAFFMAAFGQAALAAVAIAFVPTALGDVVPLGEGRLGYAVKGALNLVSTVAVVAVAWLERGLLPAWLLIGAVVIGAIEAAYGAMQFVIMSRPDLRRQLYQRKVKRGY